MQKHANKHVDTPIVYHIVDLLLASASSTVYGLLGLAVVFTYCEVLILQATKYKVAAFYSSCSGDHK